MRLYNNTLGIRQLKLATEQPCKQPSATNNPKLVYPLLTISIVQILGEKLNKT